VIAPIAWLASVWVLVADIVTIVLLIAILLVDSALTAAVCLALVFFVWFGLSLNF
jgi:hypothetical protein